MEALSADNRNYVSTFAGIGGFDIALDAAGWECHTRVEIDKHCNAVTGGWLPGARAKRDVRRTAGTRFRGVGLVCGGFPCQDLSVAGKRKGLAGKRSSLFSELVRIVDEARPRWLLWENVPGLLSSPRGDPGLDFWTVQAALAEIGYFGAWRVLDSQYFGVAQRRRRLFGLYAEGYPGACRAAAVLLEPEGGGWHPAQGGGAGQGDSGATAEGAGGLGGEGVAPAVTAKQAKQAGGPAGDECQNLVPCLRSNPYDDSDALHGCQKLVLANTLTANMDPSTGSMNEQRLRQLVQVPAPPPTWEEWIARAGEFGGTRLEYEKLYGTRETQDAAAVEMALPDVCGPLTVHTSGGGYMPNAENVRDGQLIPVSQILAPTLSTNNEVASSSTQRERWMEDSVAATGTVRRLTPTECERLQGFPVGWTIPRNKWTGWTLPKGLDSARYRACGNAVTTNVIYWIALRINAVEEMLAEMDASAGGTR